MDETEIDGKSQSVEEPEGLSEIKEEEKTEEGVNETTSNKSKV